MNKEELNKLEELYSMGFIDNKEYENRKSEILQDNLTTSNKIKLEPLNDPYAILNEKQNDDPYAILNEDTPKISNEELNFNKVPIDTNSLGKYNLPSYQGKTLVFKKEENFYFCHVFPNETKLAEIISFFGRKQKSTNEKSGGYLKGVDQINSNLIFDEIEGNIKSGIYLLQENPIEIYRGSWVAQIKGDLSNVLDYVFDIPPYLPENFQQKKMSRGPIRWEGLQSGHSFNPLFVGKFTVSGGQTDYGGYGRGFTEGGGFSYNKAPSALHFYVRLRYLQLKYSIKTAQPYGCLSLNEVLPLSISKNIEDSVEKCMEENKCYFCNQTSSSNNTFLCNEHNDEQLIQFYNEMKNQTKSKIEELESGEEFVYANGCDQYVPPQRVFESLEEKEWILNYKNKEKFRYIDPNIDIENENLGIALKDLLRQSLQK
eukprot:TRINITY_DN5758_c0_g1_i1.p1 TRINITY_DN5758_c0_g1~~TRINITY_DN5758_c0_g1_i1.p1  ORF type:complete len:436 (-),score=139.39 TRINITY_DN5758_c0_g1_i1:28-1314(-)